MSQFRTSAPHHPKKNPTLEAWAASRSKGLPGSTPNRLASVMTLAANRPMMPPQTMELLFFTPIR